MSSHLDVPTFVARWQRSTLTERSAAQQHVLDLYAALDEPTLAVSDSAGASYTFEKGMRESSGGSGWVEMRACPSSTSPIFASCGHRLEH